MNVEDDKFVQTLCPVEKEAFVAWLSELIDVFHEKLKNPAASFRSIDCIDIIEFYDCFMNGDYPQEAINELLS